MFDWTTRTMNAISSAAITMSTIPTAVISTVHTLHLRRGEPRRGPPDAAPERTIRPGTAP
jgi:hypothetical protein